MRLNILIFIVSIFISIYSIEIFMNYYFGKERIAMRIIGSKYDNRTKLELIDYLKNSGKETYPNVSPQQFINKNVNSENEIFPLGMASNVYTILDNDSGYYPVYQTDEHGFHNPKNLYNTKFDILMIGDSFIEGYSVNTEDNIASVLRKNNYKTLNIGKGGNGPLIEYASLREYGQYAEPKYVLWFYYVNDLNDLKKELKSNLLNQYLINENYSQNLIYRQNEIDNYVKNFSKSALTEAKQIEIFKRKSKQIIKLNYIRSLLKIINKSKKNDNINKFKQIMYKAKKESKKINAKLYFVYLPDLETYKKKQTHPDREQVLKTVAELNITTIDMHTEVFLKQSNPTKLFPFEIFRHYNEKGYQLVAEKIIEKLNTNN